MRRLPDDHPAIKATRRMLTDQDQWPRYTLPMKRATADHTLQLGYIEGGDDALIPPYVVKSGNIFMPQATDPIVATYDTVDALIEDGWEVD